MSELPTGTITFLLTDVEGSTALWEQLPHVMGAVIARHDALLTDAIEQHGGQVIRSRGEGDSFFAVFTRATDAVAAACALQLALAAEPWPLPSPLRVRAGLNTGEAELREGDYYGSAINRCARLRAIAHGGQTVFSLATCQLVRDDLPGGVSLRDLGSHRLKDLQRPEQVFQLLHPDLPADFPPLKSLDALPNNLPLQLTRFIGREQEMAEVKRLLADTHLLTLTGAGGAGKTRLSIQVAADLLEEYPDGVWLVELAAIAATEPARVPQEVARALGVREQPGRTLTEALVDHLRPRHLLLLLDNCEHLVAACADLVNTVLRACPNVSILATSREVLGLTGETAWRVPPLSLPERRAPPDPEQLTQYESVKLFVDRALASQPRFALTRQNAPAVAQLCQRLDGMPLPLELAAARVKVLTVEQINARLDDRFRLLTGGSRAALPRQQTLRALIDWSYDLLSEPERMVLRRLSVFAGGWDLEAAEAVCAGDGIEDWEVLDVLTQLVDKSLVVMDEEEGVARYRLLETIREYSAENLQGSGEADAVRRRHRDWYLELAEQAEPALLGGAEEECLERLEKEHDNFRAALVWSGESGEATEGLRLGGSLWPFWAVRGYLTEGRERLAALLALPGAAERTAERAKALNGAGLLAHWQGDRRAASELYEESLAIRRELRQTQGIADSLRNLGSVAMDQGDYETARALHEESLTIRRELGDQQGIAQSLQSLGSAAIDQGDLAAAQALYEESLVIQRTLGDNAGIANALNCLGMIAYTQGQYEAARALYEESLAIRRKLGIKRGVAASLTNLGIAVHSQGDTAAAQALYEESLALHRELGDKLGIASALGNLSFVALHQEDVERATALGRESLMLFCEQQYKPGIAACLGGLADIATRQGQHERAARLLGAEEALYEAMGVALPPAERAEYDQLVAAARAGAGEETFVSAWQAGRSLSLEQIVADALATG